MAILALAPTPWKSRAAPAAETAPGAGDSARIAATQPGTTTPMFQVALGNPSKGGRLWGNYHVKDRRLEQEAFSLEDQPGGVNQLMKLLKQLCKHLANINTIGQYHHKQQTRGEKPDLTKPKR
ncbi:MAG: hypothetical protein EB070_03340 [Synechococcaceae bacterium WBA_2_066]|nr:hypothetical protein [Synechococcaceae bacterium WBA_2_066]